MEALIFCASQPLQFKEISLCLSELLGADIPEQDIKTTLQKLQNKYESDEFAFKIYQVAGGYQMMTKPEYQASVAILLRNHNKKQLSKAALETLSIIAYRQPVTKTEIERIRGVASDYAIQKLLDKELVRITGKADSPGRPILYGTSEKFMEYFGINSLEDLPQPKDFSTKEEEPMSDSQ